MAHLTYRNLQKVQDCIREIYSDLNPASLPETIVKTSSKLVPAGIIDYFKSNQEGQKIDLVPISSIGKWDSLDDLNLLLHEHPFANIISSGRLKPHPYKEDIERRLLRRQRDMKGSPADAVVKISDFLTDRQFRSLAIYNDCARKSGACYQMGLPLIFGSSSYTGISFTGITFNRDKIDFSERERLLLGILGPHIIQAFRNAEVIGRMREDKTGVGAMLMDGKAKALPIEYMKILGITLREAEILHWITQGKTNSETAIILNIASGTVKRHLENIYQKLGVENRTTAAMLAMEKSGR